MYIKIKIIKVSIYIRQNIKVPLQLKADLKTIVNQVFQKIWLLLIMQDTTHRQQPVYLHTLRNVRVCKVGCELITVTIWHAHGCYVYVHMSKSSQCVLFGAMGAVTGVIKSADLLLLVPPWIHYSFAFFQIPCISTYPNRLAYGCKDAIKLYWVTEIYYNACSLIFIQIMRACLIGCVLTEKHW